MYLLEQPKRLKVVKALERAIKVAESEGVVGHFAAQFPVRGREVGLASP